MKTRYGDVQLRLEPEQAMAMGLGDVPSTAEGLRNDALALAVESTRATLRQNLADAVEQQLEREFSEQERLARTQDHQEGIRAVTQRQAGNFSRR